MRSILIIVSILLGISFASNESIAWGLGGNLTWDGDWYLLGNDTNQLLVFGSQPGETYRIEYSDDANFQSIFLTIGPNDYIEKCYTYNCNIEAPVSLPGEGLIYYRVTRTTGGLDLESKSATIEVKYDREAPILSVKSPESPTDGTVELELSMSDDTVLAYAKIFLNGVYYGLVGDLSVKWCNGGEPKLCPSEGQIVHKTTTVQVKKRTNTIDIVLSDRTHKTDTVSVVIGGSSDSGKGGPGNSKGGKKK